MSEVFIKIRLSFDNVISSKFLNLIFFLISLKRYKHEIGFKISTFVLIQFLQIIYSAIFVLIALFLGKKVKYKIIKK